MLSDFTLYYWDACVPLAYINKEMERLPHIEGLLQQSGKDFQIITSVYSVSEVVAAKIEQDQKALDKSVEEKINKLWLPSSKIQLVEFYELIARKAVSLMRKAIPKGWSLKPGDAIHLATADHLKVAEFHTYDDKLDKYQEITETQFRICRPIAKQPVMILDQKTETETARPEAPIVPPAQEAEIGKPDVPIAPSAQEAEAKASVPEKAVPPSTTAEKT